MSSNLTPASDLAPNTKVWVSDLTAEGRASLDRFLVEHARHYSGHPTELERWISQGVLDAFAERINRGEKIGFLLGSEASKDGDEHLFYPAPADVLCEEMPRFE